MIVILAALGAVAVIGLMMVGACVIVQWVMDARYPDVPNEDDEDWPTYRGQ